jgi:hypothetical protein
MGFVGLKRQAHLPPTSALASGGLKRLIWISYQSLAMPIGVTAVAAKLDFN